MSVKYASGRYSKLICDVCSWKMHYRDAVKDWLGFWVHKDPCHEGRHPQLDPARKIDDPQSLQHARPDVVSPTVAHPGSDITTIYPDTSGGGNQGI